MKAERMSSDRISTLPQPILEAILCLLPTKVAARTSILSREWRYKWTKIPKLDISHSKRSNREQAFDVANMDMRCKRCYIIHQILLVHQGPVYELTLNLPEDNCLELDQIIVQLFSNHPIKKLTLQGWDFEFRWYKFSISAFSLHHLTDLDLCCVDLDLDLDHPQIFNGFGNLKSLYLNYVEVSSKTLLQLLSNSPSLKNLSLLIVISDDKCTATELFECLPSIEHLTTSTQVSEFLVLDSVPQEHPTSLMHLKYLHFEQLFLGDGYGLSFLLLLIKCSPNLEKIKLEYDPGDHIYDEYSVVWEEYSNVCLEHLNELEIGWFSCLKREMDFVKFILARSPKLQKVSINAMVCMHEKMEMLEVLLRAPRASPVRIYV